MPRLFAAIELPDEVRETLARLRRPLPGARWIEPENMHITLRFAGDISNDVAEEFASGLSSIRESAFSLRLAGAGSFGGNMPTALWCGVDKSRELEALQRATERAARQAGLPPETRAFKPHVTLARLSNARPDALARFLEKTARIRIEPFFVSRFVLMSSRPRTGGGPYVVEEGFTLAGGLPDHSGLEDLW